MFSLESWITPLHNDDKKCVLILLCGDLLFWLTQTFPGIMLPRIIWPTFKRAKNAELDACSMVLFCCQATFCGSSLGKKKGFHFSVADYESMGYHFCDTLLDYCDPDNTKVRIFSKLKTCKIYELPGIVQSITRPARKTKTLHDRHACKYTIESSSQQNVWVKAQLVGLDN